MSREDCRAWAERQSAGRFERVNGVVVSVAPERANNNLRKFRARRHWMQQFAPQGFVEVLSPGTSAIDRAWKLQE
jgi:hypothetical protein